MQRGDVILTPTWNWHDHGKDGSGPMIWLDALDLPLFQFFPVHFVEHYKESRYPAEDIDTSQSPIVFPWSSMKERLDSEQADWAEQRYVKADGSEGTFLPSDNSASMDNELSIVSKTLGGSAERLNPGCSSPFRRETTSFVYHVIEGTGHSDIGGKDFEWKRGDTFCIPSWNKFQHVADKGQVVYLYRFDDKPMLTSLGFYRTEDMDVEGLVS